MVEKSITGVVTWLKNWFPLRGNLDDSYTLEKVYNDLNNAKVNNNLGVANKNVVTNGTGVITTEDKPTIDSTPTSNSTNAVQSGGVYTALDGKVDKVTGKGLSTNDYTTTEKNKLASLSNYTHPSSHPTTFISNDQAYNNIKSGESTTVTLTNQKLINDAINSKLGDLASIDFINIVETLPSPSESTMGKLYIIEENSKVNVYYTKHYDQEPHFRNVKMDADILDELTWANINGKPTKTSDFTNDGSSSSDQLVYVETSTTSGLIKNDGTIMTGGTNSNQYAIGNHNHSGVYAPYSHTHSTSLSSNTGDLKIIVGDNNVANLGLWLNSTMGYKTDDIDWSYNSDGFTNGIKLESKNTDATGKITFHLKS